MSPFALRLLRRLALGLPLAAALPGGALVLAATACGGDCGRAATEHFAVTSLELARLTRADGTPDDAACLALCSELARGAARPGVADGGLADAGASVGASLGFEACHVVDERDGPSIACKPRPYGCGVGRVPAGLVAAATEASLGGFLAHAAWLEASARHAFLDLERELGAHGAPAPLARRARAAARDEARHAAIFATLARRAGARVPTVRRTAPEVRSLADMALDNAGEGLGREALGALFTAHQASHAGDPALARAYRAIAPDEARHALFSADVHAWASSRLDRATLERCETERRALLFALASEPSGADAAHARALGLPGSSLRAALASTLA